MLLRPDGLCPAVPYFRLFNPMTTTHALGPTIPAAALNVTPAYTFIDRPEQLAPLLAALGIPASLGARRYGRPCAMVVTVRGDSVQHAERADRRGLLTAAGGLFSCELLTVAERDATLAIVVQGLDPGDHVIAEAPPGLRAGAQVTVVP